MRWIFALRCRWFPEALALLVCFMLAPALALGESFVFGQTEHGRDMECIRLGEENAPRSILMVFAIHGFEGARDRDGEVLVEIARRVIAHYEQKPEELEGFTLYIVPCANPDGLIEGVGEDDVGRLNASGININRDFSQKWRKIGSPRDRTGEAPFATAEARAIRDLVEELQPTYGIDVHGWINGVYGDYDFAHAFWESFGFPIRELSGSGMLAQWMQTQVEAAIMIELPHRPGREGYVDDNAPRLIEGLNIWMRTVKKPPPSAQTGKGVV